MQSPYQQFQEDFESAVKLIIYSLCALYASVFIACFLFL